MSTVNHWNYDIPLAPGSTQWWGFKGLSWRFFPSCLDIMCNSRQISRRDAIGSTPSTWGRIAITTISSGHLQFRAAKLTTCSYQTRRDKHGRKTQVRAIFMGKMSSLTQEVFKHHLIQMWQREYRHPGASARPLSFRPSHSLWSPGKLSKNTSCHACAEWEDPPGWGQDLKNRQFREPRALENW